MLAAEELLTLRSGGDATNGPAPSTMTPTVGSPVDVAGATETTTKSSPTAATSVSAAVLPHPTPKATASFSILQSTVQEWSTVQLSQHIRTWDEQFAHIVVNKEGSSAEKTKLVTTVKQFGASFKQEPTTDKVEQLLKFFKTFINSLYERVDLSEHAFVSLYNISSTLKDPVPVLLAVQEEWLEDKKWRLKLEQEKKALIEEIGTLSASVQQLQQQLQRSGGGAQRTTSSGGIMGDLMEQFSSSRALSGDATAPATTTTTSSSTAAAAGEYQEAYETLKVQWERLQGDYQQHRLTFQALESEYGYLKEEHDSMKRAAITSQEALKSMQRRLEEIESQKEQLSLQHERDAELFTAMMHSSSSSSSTSTLAASRGLNQGGSGATASSVAALEVALSSKEERIAFLLGEIQALQEQVAREAALRDEVEKKYAALLASSSVVTTGKDRAADNATKTATPLSPNQQAAAGPVGEEYQQQVQRWMSRIVELEAQVKQRDLALLKAVSEHVAASEQQEEADHNHHNSNNLKGTTRRKAELLFLGNDDRQHGSSGGGSPIDHDHHHHRIPSGFDHHGDVGGSKPPAAGSAVSSTFLTNADFTDLFASSSLGSDTMPGGGSTATKQAASGAAEPTLVSSLVVQRNKLKSELKEFQERYNAAKEECDRLRRRADTLYGERVSLEQSLRAALQNTGGGGGNSTDGGGAATNGGNSGRHGRSASNSSHTVGYAVAVPGGGVGNGKPGNAARVPFEHLASMLVGILSSRNYAVRLGFVVYLVALQVFVFGFLFVSSNRCAVASVGSLKRGY